MICFALLTGFVAGIYGKDVVQGPSLPIEERRELTTSFLNPPSAIRSRIAAALDALKIDELSEVADTSKVVAIGYCFGGTGALEFMRDEPEGLLGKLTPSYQFIHFRPYVSHAQY